jgi:raffinose/stachyose/melibiose transport system permease protein
MTAQASTQQAAMPAPARGDTPAPRRRRLPGQGVNWWATAFIIMCSLTVLVPMYFVVVTAFKDNSELAANAFALPRSWSLANFREAWVTVNYPRTALVSALITVGALIGTILTHSMVAYAIARNMDHSRFFRFLYYFFISALFIPFPVVMLPLVKQTALMQLDNPAGLILIYLVYGLAFNIMLFTSYIRSIPLELEESAAMDGASRWGIFWKIIFPLLGPMNATVGIFTVLWAWNDFLMPLVILSDPGTNTLPLAQYVFQGQFNVNYTVSFASYLMAILPTVIVYIFAQRWIISGVLRGSSK